MKERNLVSSIPNKEIVFDHPDRSSVYLPPLPNIFVTEKKVVSYEPKPNICYEPKYKKPFVKTPNKSKRSSHCFSPQNKHRNLNTNNSQYVISKVRHIFEIIFK